jgi:hypothetical protein
MRHAAVRPHSCIAPWPSEWRFDQVAVVLARNLPTALVLRRRWIQATCQSSRVIPHYQPAQVFEQLHHATHLSTSDTLRDRVDG